MFTVYHANYSNECKKFLSDSSYLIISHDKDYLGDGMYFWGNKNSAGYWLKTKKADAESNIVCADIISDKILDLSDDETNVMLENMYNRIEKFRMQKYGGVIPVGVKLNYLFGSFLKDKYDVIKGIEAKGKKEDAAFLFGSQLTTKSVDIYCVKVTSAISNRKQVS